MKPVDVLKNLPTTKRVFLRVCIKNDVTQLMEITKQQTRELVDLHFGGEIIAYWDRQGDLILG